MRLNLLQRGGGSLRAARRRVKVLVERRAGGEQIGARGIELALRPHGGLLFTASSEGDPETERDILLEFYRRRVAGLVVMTAFISPYRDDRARARQIVGERFIEVHVDADVATCEARDPKGLYKKARAGEIGDFTGISAPYEAPENPEIRIDTSAKPLEECVADVLQYLIGRGVIA